jgi:phosphate transport system permease protein
VTATATIDLTSKGVAARRRFRDRLAKTLVWLAVAAAALPLGLVVYQVVSRGAGIIDWQFLNWDIPRNYRREGPGMGPAVLGTILITGAATLISVPLGIAGAIYLNEYGRNKPIARVIRTMTDVMTGVPSIVMGLFVYITWVLTFGKQSGFAGALALACLMLPIVIRSSEEMLRLVPDELRQGSAALGTPKWKTIMTVVLPSAASGITSGSLLAVARAAGETAPVVVTIGIAFSPNWNLFDGGNTTLAAQIYRNASLAFESAQERAWGAALTLIAIVMVFTVAARLIANRYAVKER